uniref:Putative DEAH-box RNA helicase (ISS) n=1 Tax=mine drainage metagenome TaxID=410659 RepID=E6QKB0_9ZZZZ
MADVPTGIEVGAPENRTDVGFGFWPGSVGVLPMQAVSVSTRAEANSGSRALNRDA